MSRPGIAIPAINRTVSVTNYCQAIRKAKANPTATFPHGLTTWWPTTGEAIVGQFHAEMHDRITARRPLSRSTGPAAS